jgi:DNA invertase Pin-like site-specific DNA recombinase
MKIPASLAGKRIAKYIRCSKEMQDEERQIFSTDQWAKFNGLYIEESFEDTEGANSRDMSAKRVQFQKMLKACENGDYDAIVVDSLDRFGFKNNKELQHYLYMLDQWGVELWSVSQGCISDDDVATVFNTTAAAITSEKEQREKALRNLEGRMGNSKKGNYCGGPPAFGCDVACYGVDGKEKWRVVWMGRQQRLKYNPDGSTEEYNGPNNFPSRDQTDTLRLAPTIKEERLNAVRQIFQWYADELISYYQIATRLNENKIESLHSAKKLWNKGHVQHILHNPVFIGMPTDNKKGQGRFYEFKNGKVRPVIEGEENRVRQAQDYWRPAEPIFDPIVPLDVWEKVQKKLSERTTKAHSPNPHRQADFWLQPFVYCSNCGKKMRSVKVKNGKSNNYCKYYSCSTYSCYGPLNEYGCQSNTVSKTLMEEVAEAYLKEARMKLAFDSRLDNLDADYEMQSLKELGDKNKITISVRDDLKDYIRSQLAGCEGNMAISEAYKLADKDREAAEDIAGQIKQKQKMFEELYQHAKLLTDDAKVRANEDMNTVSKEIKRLRAMLAPQDRSDKIEREFTQFSQKVEQAIWSMSTVNHRQKAQAVGKVIGKIICHYEKFDRNKQDHLALGTFGARKRKTVLTSIEIVPVSMEKSLFRLADEACLAV